MGPGMSGPGAVYLVRRLFEMLPHGGHSGFMEPLSLASSRPSQMLRRQPLHLPEGLDWTASVTEGLMGIAVYAL